MDENENELRARMGFDQGAAWLADNLPPMWRRMYENCKREGFDDADSLALVKSYIISQGPGNKSP